MTCWYCKRRKLDFGNESNLVWEAISQFPICEETKLNITQWNKYETVRLMQTEC